MKKNKWKPFNEARQQVQKLKFKNLIDFKKNIRKHFNDIPIHPDATYKNDGWKGWNDFLGKIKFFSYEECQSFLRANNIKSKQQLEEFLNPKEYMIITEMEYLENLYKVASYLGINVLKTKVFNS